MRPSLEILSCAPGDRLLSGVIRMVYPTAPGRPLPPDGDKEHLKQCFVAIQESQTVGCISVYQNPAIIHNGKPTIQLGNFECIESITAARGLLDAATDLGKRLGVSFAVGPMNGSTWNQYRFISELGAVPAFFTELSHPAYYPGLWQEAGFVPIHQYLSNIAPVREQEVGNMAFFEKHGLTERPICTDCLEEDLQIIYPLCTAAFAQNPFYSPVSREQFVAKLMVLQPILVGSFTRIVFNASGEPLAFILCFPDILDKQGKTLVLKTAAKHPDRSVPGVITALYYTILSHTHANGYEQIIHAFMHADNNSVRRSMQFEGKIIRRYALYAKSC